MLLWLKSLKPKLLAYELEQEKQLFDSLVEEEVANAPSSAPTLAKHFITYQGALKSAAARVILRELGV